MNRIFTLALIIFALGAISPSTIFAAEDVNTKGRVVMKAGDKIHLFHSGTGDVRKEICLNDVIPVYRESTTGFTPQKVYQQVKTTKEVGKVKVLSYVGDHYFEAQVVEGTARVGDVAAKKGAYCLVQPSQQ